MIDSVKPDMIEIMPGIAYKAISAFAEKLSIPVIAGGLVQTSQEVEEAIKHGAEAISTGNTKLW
ncbi:MAG: glycerol-3-phosphate responsive antiterminator [Clostridia bacterium]|nr:glycerol-3-phosphate responsive antiterminator [Clostridia bacterium]